jgi:hypothetical protein
MRLFFFSVLTIFCLISFGQETKNNFEFSISFAACFQNDLVGLKVNGKTLIISQKVTSDPVLGIDYRKECYDCITNTDTISFSLDLDNKFRLKPK